MPNGHAIVDTELLHQWRNGFVDIDQPVYDQMQDSGGSERLGHRTQP